MMVLGVTGWEPLTPSIFSNEPPGYWTNVNIDVYYVLSEDLSSRNGKTFYGGNAYITDGAASDSTYPAGSKLYIEELKSWVIIDDKIPNMKPNTVYIRTLSKRPAEVKTSRAYIVLKRRRR